MTGDIGEESRRRMIPRLLTWAEADPAQHPFDPAGALTAVREIAPPRPPHPDHRSGPSVPATGGPVIDKAVTDGAVIEEPAAREAVIDGAEPGAANRAARLWCEAVSHGLAAHYGRWAIGWSWGGAAGPVDNWSDGWPITGPDDTLELVATALREWRSWLEELADRFDQLLPMSETDPSSDWESAARQLITLSLDRTLGAAHCKWVLTSFLTAAGIGDDNGELIDKAIGNAFDDGYIAPTRLEIARAAERVAEAVTGRPVPEPLDPEPLGRIGRTHLHQT